MATQPSGGDMENDVEHDRPSSEQKDRRRLSGLPRRLVDGQINQNSLVVCHMLPEAPDVYDTTEVCSTPSIVEVIRGRCCEDRTATIRTTSSDIEQLEPVPPDKQTPSPDFLVENVDSHNLPIRVFQNDDTERRSEDIEVSNKSPTYLVDNEQGQEDGEERPFEDESHGLAHIAIRRMQFSLQNPSRNGNDIDVKSLEHETILDIGSACAVISRGALILFGAFTPEYHSLVRPLRAEDSLHYHTYAGLWRPTQFVFLWAKSSELDFPWTRKAFRLWDTDEPYICFDSKYAVERGWINSPYPPGPQAYGREIIHSPGLLGVTVFHAPINEEGRRLKEAAKLKADQDAEEVKKLSNTSAITSTSSETSKNTDSTTDTKQTQTSTNTSITTNTEQDGTSSKKSRRLSISIRKRARSKSKMSSKHRLSSG